MATLIEACARVLCEAAGRDPDCITHGSSMAQTGGMNFTAVYKRAWQQHVGQARAMLRAMREPSETMLAAMCRAEDAGTKRDEWQAAIDAALSQDGDSKATGDDV